MPASCLTFIAEGQTVQFCGVHCQTSQDCPSGYDCTGVIHSCTSSSTCTDPAAPGATITCETYNVENEPEPLRFCADPDGEPHEYVRACAPSSGFCPATASP